MRTGTDEGAGPGSRASQRRPPSAGPPIGLSATYRAIGARSSRFVTRFLTPWAWSSSKAFPLHHSPTLAMFHLRDLGAHAPAYLETDHHSRIGRWCRSRVLHRSRPVSTGVLMVQIVLLAMFRLPKSSALGSFHQHEYLASNGSWILTESLRQALRVRPGFTWALECTWWTRWCRRAPVRRCLLGHTSCPSDASSDPLTRPEYR